MHCLIPFEGKYFTFFIWSSSPSGMEIKKKTMKKLNKIKSQFRWFGIDNKSLKSG